MKSNKPGSGPSIEAAANIQLQAQLKKPHASMPGCSNIKLHKSAGYLEISSRCKLVAFNKASEHGCSSLILGLYKTLILMRSPYSVTLRNCTAHTCELAEARFLFHRELHPLLGCPVREQVSADVRVVPPADVLREELLGDRLAAVEILLQQDLLIPVQH